MKKIHFLAFIILCSTTLNSQIITGELKKWHRITLTYDGPSVNENDNPNPFRDYRMVVTFTGPSNQIYTIPGYFAADGDAANTSATSGNKWRAHFAPDDVGQWSYTTSFRTGNNIAVSTNLSEGSATSFDNTNGTITILPTDKTGIDNRGKGRLNYVNERYLKFAETNQYFLKAGADSPENLLAFDDFDATSNKDWGPHVNDWSNGDPVWQNDKGKGLIGAVNYLASKGMNVFSFLTMNVNGDGNDVWPWVSSSSRDRFDVSKLAQWEIVFDHADKKGMFLHFKTQETENDQLLNNGDLGIERKLYYRELIARFGHHLALNWNLGEENVQSEQQRKDMAQYFFDTDPYNHLIVLHTGLGGYNNIYTPLLGDASKLTGVSLQTQISNVHNVVKNWVEKSENANKPWCVASDEIGNSSIGVGADSDYLGGTGSQGDNRVDVRHLTLYGALLGGGHGVEYYFGYQTGQTDLSCEDFRSREHKWEDAKIALDFFHDYIPFWDMVSSDDLVSNNDTYCFSKTNENYLVYLPANETTLIDLGNNNESYEVKWFNPRTGGSLQDGTIASVNANGFVSIGNPPNQVNEDWLALIRNTATLSNLEFQIDAFKFYPNPSKSSFRIGGLKEGKYNLQIVNALGQLVFETEVSQSKNEIAISTFSKGLYLVKIYKNQNEIVKKLIIN